MKSSPAAKLAADVNRRRHAEQLDEYMIAFAVSGNGLHLWAALRHCRAHGLPVPEDLLARLAECGERLVNAARKPGAGARAFSAALDLQAGSRGMTAAQRAEQQRRKVRKLRWMDYLRRKHPGCGSIAQAAEAVADAAFSARTLANDYAKLMEKPPRDWRAAGYNAFAAASPMPQRRRRVSSKKGVLR